MPSEYEALRSKLVNLDLNSENSELAKSITEYCYRQPHETIRLIHSIYCERRWAAVYMATHWLQSIGFIVPVTELPAAHAALRFGDISRFRQSLQRLEQRDRAANPGQDEIFHNQMSVVLAPDALEHLTIGDHNRAYALVDLALTIEPILNPVEADLSCSVQRQRYMPQRSSHSLQRPPKLLIVGKPKIFDAKSRPLELWARIALAAERSGWIATVRDSLPTHDPKYLTWICQTISETSPDVIIFDDFGLVHPHEARIALWSAITEIRRNRPALKIIGIYTDPWIPGQGEAIAASTPYADLVWCPLPTLPFWDNPAFNNKLLFSPFPIGITVPVDVSPEPRIGFTGAVNWYNWSRAIWLVQLSREGFNPDIQLSTHNNDNLDALVSFENYLRRVAKSEVCLNFSLRQASERTVTGRVFETIAVGRLLVQQATPDLDVYLAPGLECLSFRSIGDLRHILSEWRTDPNQYHRIAEAGHRRFNDDFSDQVTFRNIEAELWFK